MNLRTVLTELTQINTQQTPKQLTAVVSYFRQSGIGGITDRIQGKVLLFPLVEMFSKVGGQQAADAVIRQEHVEVSQQTALGFEWFVLRPQDLVWDDLAYTGRHYDYGCCQ